VGSPSGALSHRSTIQQGYQWIGASTFTRAPDTVRRKKLTAPFSRCANFRLPASRGGRLRLRARCHLLHGNFDIRIRDEAHHVSVLRRSAPGPRLVQRPSHRRHLCRHFPDSEIGIGNPICGVRDACGAKTLHPRPSKKEVHIRQEEFPGWIQIWGSNPAFIWTSEAAEEEGIHVHAFSGDRDEPELDETYSVVAIDGVNLDPAMVRILMAQMILPSLKNRVLSITCPACLGVQFSVGEFAFTPSATETCAQCGNQFTAPGRLRKIVANPLPALLARVAETAPRQPQKHDLGLMRETL